MIGKKKKQEEKPAEQNDLDKPQTLAELDAMAREKKDDGKVVMDAENVASSGEPDHEVTHSDEHTVDTNVKRVTNSQRRLWVIVALGSGVLIVGMAIFYTQLEDGSGIGIGAGGGEVLIEEDGQGHSDLLPRGTYAYIASPGQTNYTRYNLDDSTPADIDKGGGSVLVSS